MDTGCSLLMAKEPLILAPATDSLTCSTLTLTGEFSDRHKVLLFTSQQVGASSDSVVFADDVFLTRLVCHALRVRSVLPQYHGRSQADRDHPTAQLGVSASCR
jgi:hypothetical protein